MLPFATRHTPESSHQSCAQLDAALVAGKQVGARNPKDRLEKLSQLLRCQVQVTLSSAQKEIERADMLGVAVGQ